MKYLSICSGIEAATVAWKPLGWQAVGFSEIEPFPCAVLAHHYPEVKNYGDMTRYEEWDIEPGSVDLICGGTPCQDFSIAGKRAGIDGDRGSLTNTFFEIVNYFRPKYFVWENVPGILSLNSGNTFSDILNFIGDMGYIIDVDILDSQFMGVPQRRRRIFICGQSRESLLRQKSISSALTIAQCLTEILHGSLIEMLLQLGKKPQSLELQSLSKDGMKKRMKLFGVELQTGQGLTLLQNHLIEVWQKYLTEQKNSACHSEKKEAEFIADGQLWDSREENQYSITGLSLSENLEEALNQARLSIISTSTNLITEKKIYICSQAVLHIAKLTHLLSKSFPHLWSAASSSLIALKECINYARSTSRELFTEYEWVFAWDDFIRKAQDTYYSIGCLRTGNFGEILSISASLQRDITPRREKRERIAADVIGSLTGSGRGVERVGESRGQDPVIPVVCGSVSSKWAKGTGGPAGDECYNLVAHALRAEGHDALEDGTGRGTPIVAQQVQWASGGGEVLNDTAQALRTGAEHNYQFVAEPVVCGQDGDITGNIMETLTRNEGQSSNDTSHMVIEPVAMHETGQGFWQEGDISGTIRAEGENRPSRPSNVVHSQMRVRRLTPRECERLQGFPDDYTLIPYGRKKQRIVVKEPENIGDGGVEICIDTGPSMASDSARYKALGNSWAVPVPRWIGQRIQLFEGLRKQRKGG